MRQASRDEHTPQRGHTRRRPAATLAQYKSLFQDSPASLWEEDFGDIKKHIEGLQVSGVQDFREYFDSHPDVVAQLARMVKVVDVNQATLKLYKARSLEEFRDGLATVFTKESYHAFKEELIALARGKLNFEAEATTRTLKGDRKHVFLRWTVAPGFEETLSRVFVHIIDVTKRKRAEEALRESEERFRTLVDAAFEGVFIHEKGRILDANQALATMSGYELPELIGMNGLDLVAPESRDLVGRNILSGYNAVYEFIGLRKDGTTVPLEVRGRPTRYKGRTVRVAAVRDLTERKQMEETLQEAREELEGKVEARMRLGPVYGLTFRELTVLHAMAAGKANKEIGLELGISPLTVEKHVAHILEKMGAISRTEASVRAVHEGLVRWAER